MLSLVPARGKVLCGCTVPMTSKVPSLQRKMANFKFSYVRDFETNDRVAPDQWIVIKLENNDPDFKKQAMQDRKSRLMFTDFMNRNAADVMDHFKEIRFSYVHSASAHFAFDGKTTTHQRRSSKLVSYLASCLSSTCVLNWSKFLNFPMNVNPCFEGKVFLFPSDQHVRDYFTLNQMNHHLDNLRQTLIEAINGDYFHVTACVSSPCSSAITSVGAPDAGQLTIDTPSLTVDGANVADTSPKFGSGPTAQPGEAFNTGASNEENTTLENRESEKTGCVDLDEDQDSKTDATSGGKDDLDMAPSIGKNPVKVDLLASAASGTEAYCNEQLFSRFRINYNCEPKILKKGTFIFRQKSVSNGSKREPSYISSYHEDLRKNVFWESLHVLANETRFNAKFYMIQKFERDCQLTPHAWVVVRLDGKAFHKLSQVHGFKKPNDIRAIELMNISAATLMKAMPDILIAYGESDEYSFVFQRYGTRHKRNADALVSQCVSIFTATYVENWPFYFGGSRSLNSVEENKTHFSDESAVATDSTSKDKKVASDCQGSESTVSNEVKLQLVPIFDGRAVVYPTTNSLRDYLSWRQADCHINNMFNTAFWSLVEKKGYTRSDAEKKLNGTVSKEKREILLEMDINYSEEPAIHRKGSVIYRNQKARVKPGHLKKDLSQLRNRIWWSNECRNVKKVRLDIRKKYFQSFSEDLLLELLEAEINASRVIKQAKTKHGEHCDAMVHQVSSLPGSQDSDTLPGKDAASGVLIATDDSNSEASSCKSKVVIPENFLENFEKLFIIEELDPKKRNEILNSFHKNDKAWWTMECHVAKIVKLDAKTAYKTERSEEAERTFHLASIRFKACVQQAKKRFKRSLYLEKKKTAQQLRESIKENCPQEELLFDGSEETACGQKETVVDQSGDPLKEREANFQHGVHDLEENAGQADDTVEAESTSQEQNPVLGEGDHLHKESEMKATQSIEAGQELDPLESEDHGSSTVSSDSNPSEDLMAIRMAEHRALVASLDSHLVLCFDDIIGDKFWRQHPRILGKEKSVMQFEETV